MRGDGSDTTNICTLGAGKRLLVVHGGPGFSHHYLVKGLSFLAKHHELIFYDQPGCGPAVSGQPSITLETTARHFTNLCRALAKGQPLDVIVHSWGGLVLLAALRQAPDILRLLDKTVFINPLPVDRQNYEAARFEFIARLPAHVAKLYQELITDAANGAAIMELLLPFYSSNLTGLKGEDFHLNIATYLGNDTSLGDFDYRAQIDRLSAPCFLLGGRDFVPLANLPFIEVAGHVHLIPSAGHFPFYEDAQRTKALLHDCFT